MKAKIDKYGYLHLEKNGKMTLQLCHGPQSCGIHCPLFRIYSWPLSNRPNIKNLHFCHNVTITVDEISYENED